MGNRAMAIDLAAANRMGLERPKRSPSCPPGPNRGAGAVLLIAKNVAETDVARLSGYTTVQVSRIRRHFGEERIVGLTGRPRSGRPPHLSEARSARIVAPTLNNLGTFDG